MRKQVGLFLKEKNSIMAVKDICDNTGTDSVIVNFVYDVIIKRIPPKVAFKTLWDKIED